MEPPVLAKVSPLVKNLLEVMDMIVLAATDDYGKIIMTIKYERREENENKQ